MFKGRLLWRRLFPGRRQHRRGARVAPLPLLEAIPVEEEEVAAVLEQVLGSNHNHHHENNNLIATVITADDIRETPEMAQVIILDGW